MQLWWLLTLYLVLSVRGQQGFSLPGLIPSYDLAERLFAFKRHWLQHTQESEMRLEWTSKDGTEFVKISTHHADFQLFCCSYSHAINLNLQFHLRSNQAFSVTTFRRGIVQLKPSSWWLLPAGTEPQKAEISLHVSSQKLGLDWMLSWLRPVFCDLYNSSTQFQQLPESDYCKCVSKGEDPPALGMLVTVSRRSTKLDFALTFLLAFYIVLGGLLNTLRIHLYTLPVWLEKSWMTLFCLSLKFLLTPLIALLFTHWLPLEAEYKLVIFILSTCPAVGYARQFILVMGGNANLAATISLVLNAASVAIIPLWIMLYCSLFYVPQAFNFAIVFGLLLLVSVPQIMGLVLAWLNLSLVDKRLFIWVTNFHSFLIIPAIVALGVITNIELVKQIPEQFIMILISALVPMTAFSVHLLIILALKRPNSEAISMLLTTIPENSGIAYLIVHYGLVRSEADASALLVLISSVVSCLPVALVMLERANKNTSGVGPDCLGDIGEEWRVHHYHVDEIGHSLVAKVIRNIVLLKDCTDRRYLLPYAEH
ncbi:hypothetical protein Ciccas_009417 [Cichlidogyrus casuarinus]|uniref:Uncharacterized protein n=1 Tax=Cichlidogyrus casuarinus TaxID=1844966 RepID=A0ABD2PX40_9PLAT